MRRYPAYRPDEVHLYFSRAGFYRVLLRLSLPGMLVVLHPLRMLWAYSAYSERHL